MFWPPFATVWALAENQSNELILVTQKRGLAKFSKESGKIVYLEQSDDIETQTNYWDLAIDAKGNYWAASSNGLIAYKEKDGRIIELGHLFEGDIIDHIHFHDDSISIQH